MSSTTHTERTAAQSRSPTLHPVTLTTITTPNPTIRILTLRTQHPITFLPGQWLDVHIPSLPKPGGFTITSTPTASSVAGGHIELAVQASDNPPAAWLWRREEQILGSQLRVRVGGDFVWPREGIQRALFVAGGVGINPLISMLAHVVETETPLEALDFMYTTKAPPPGSQILFLSRLLGLRARRPDLRVHLFLTSPAPPLDHGPDIAVHTRRLTSSDFAEVLGASGPHTTAFVCGPPDMTDDAVEQLRDRTGAVHCEKWW
ncbi:ferredoxin reductase-like protein [Trichodelitschia bisporula]|uniref:Oxidoreductase NAD-binding domain-containing protein 1 n=1 Tax=Trichodelitschia bisporula TaxID=703511 RepID=A0A6G1HUF0_9PEZI|nr:ferredoxin reductase-like protein [Trichodelitschia bisporula]